MAANGDTANKIGTYQIAIVAKHHGVPFYLAAPSTSVDLNISTGRDIVIEERPHAEMTSIAGVPITADGLLILVDSSLGVELTRELLPRKIMADVKGVYSSLCGNPHLRATDVTCSHSVPCHLMQVNVPSEISVT